MTKVILKTRARQTITNFMVATTRTVQATTTFMVMKAFSITKAFSGTKAFSITMAFLISAVFSPTHAATNWSQFPPTEKKLADEYSRLKNSSDRQATSKLSQEIDDYCRKQYGQHIWSGNGPSPDSQCRSRIKGINTGMRIMR